MNEEQKQAVEAAKAFVASGHEYETFGVWSIEQLLSIITAQQAEIAALKAELDGANALIEAALLKQDDGDLPY